MYIRVIKIRPDLRPQRHAPHHVPYLSTNHCYASIHGFMGWHNAHNGVQTKQRHFKGVTLHLLARIIVRPFTNAKTSLFRRRDSEVQAGTFHTCDFCARLASEPECQAIIAHAYFLKIGGPVPCRRGKPRDNI
jgi:hypothetical protein